ncbi:hypothetical protein [Saccharopolyspora griseoalba]|uniref:Uncharacterized protein n=1 Tax=Saccharopolyspora griseoalba TaxID=1431848 RepID=A0ABW2LPL3_9PSEU
MSRKKGVGMIESCGHGTGSGTHVRVLDLLRKSYRLVQDGDPAWRNTTRMAQALCPQLCAEVALGHRDGTVPPPNSAEWERWLNKRTGTTAAFRVEHAIPDRGSTPPQPKRKTTSARRAKTPPQRSSSTEEPQRSLAGFSHVALAQKWVAVQGDHVPATALAAMLGLPQHQLAQAATEIADLLALPPWRLRVRRGGFVSCTHLHERCQDLLWRTEDARPARPRAGRQGTATGDRGRTRRR